MPTDARKLMSTEQEIIGEAEEAQQRNPFKNDWGFLIFDGVSAWTKGWFEEEEDLLEFIVKYQPFIDVGQINQDYLELKTKIEKACIDHKWHANDDLLAKINNICQSKHSITWWGSFKEELLKGIDGAFSFAIEELAESEEKDPEDINTTKLKERQKAVIVEAIENFGN